MVATEGWRGEAVVASQGREDWEEAMVVIGKRPW